MPQVSLRESSPSAACSWIPRGSVCSLQADVEFPAVAERRETFDDIGTAASRLSIAAIGLSLIESQVDTSSVGKQAVDNAEPRAATAFDVRRRRAKLRRDDE
jgi:hypothetical protein